MTTVRVTWHPDAMERALKRLIDFRDGFGPLLRRNDEAVMVAIDALRSLKTEDD